MEKENEVKPESTKLFPKKELFRGTFKIFSVIFTLFDDPIILGIHGTYINGFSIAKHKFRIYGFWTVDIGLIFCKITFYITNKNDWGQNNPYKPDED